MKHHKWIGFTLIEMMITVTVAAILALIAVPSYVSFMQNNDTISVMNQLSSMLNYARIEAIKRGVQVSVCSAQDNPVTACGNETSWTNGWLIFVDANHTQTPTPPDYLKVNQPVSQDVIMTANIGVVSYNSSGYLNSTPFVMVMQPISCFGNQVRTLTINAYGRLSIQTTVCSGG